MTSTEPQVFQPDPYQQVPANVAPENVTGQMGEEPYNVNYSQEFVNPQEFAPQEQVPDQVNYPYGSGSSTQAVTTNMGQQEEPNVISREPSEIHFYGAMPSGNSSQFYEGDSFEHLKKTPRQSETSLAQPENFGVARPHAEQNYDYYSMSNYQVTEFFSSCHICFNGFSCQHNLPSSPFLVRILESSWEQATTCKDRRYS